MPSLQGLESRRVERLDPLLELAVERLAKVVGEERDVALDFAQRGQGDGGDGDPIVEIGPELAGVHLLFQLSVGGRDEAQADLDLVGAAEPAKAPALEEIEQLGLHLRAELRDFVEEQGTAVGHLDESALGFPGVREGTLLVAEQLGLEQVGGQRRAVDLDEPPR